MAFLFLLFPLVWSAPHAVTFPEHVPYSHVRRLVQLDDQNEMIKKLGPEGYKHLRDMMFSTTESVDDRWKATLSLAKIGGVESLPDLDLALKNPQWFLRAAGLLGTSLAHREAGERRAKEFLHTDPALLVRAVALQVLAQQNTLDKDFLWSEIYNPINFNNGKGLPLRLSILKVLEKSMTSTDAAKLTALMREDNKDIQALAKTTLSRIYSSKSKRVSAR